MSAPAIEVQAPRRSTLPAALIRLLPWLAAALLIWSLPQVFTSRYAMTLLNQTGIAIIFALSYNMLLGQGGMLSFGHAVFFGLGGFVAVHALKGINAGSFWWPLELLPLIGAAMGALSGFVAGWLATRRAGTAFAMITLGIGELVAASAFILSGFFGGEAGISGDRMTGTSLFGFSYGPPRQVYFLIAAWLLVSAALMRTLAETPLGRLANAVRDNPMRAEFLGYEARRIRLIQFVLSATFAGIAGGLLAIQYEILTADSVSLAQSGNVLLMTYLGGIGSFAGPVLGAVAVTLLQSLLSTVTTAWPLYLGLTFILVVMLAPGGLAGLVRLHGPAWRAGRLHHLLPAYALALPPVLLLAGGFVLLVETLVFLSRSPGSSGSFRVFWTMFDARSPLPWALAFAGMLGGGYWLARVRGRVAAAWEKALPPGGRR